MLNLKFLTGTEVAFSQLMEGLKAGMVPDAGIFHVDNYAIWIICRVETEVEIGD